MLQKVLESLNSLQGSNNHIRKEAERFLLEQSVSNFGGLINALLDILTNHTVGTIGDTITAGIVLKTLFAWESPEKMNEVNTKWMVIPEEDKNAIKNKLMNSLSVCTGSTGEILGQCLGSVARIEVVNKRWYNIFSTLSEIIRSQSITEVTRMNILETVGILCMNTKGMDESVIISSSGAILTVLIVGCTACEISTQKSAYKNLKRSLGFLSQNIAAENECVVLMETLFKGCSSEDEDVACLALECYTTSINLYYDAVIKYAGMAFGNISMAYMDSDSDRKILCGIEMWGSIAEHEIITGKNEVVSKIFKTLAGQCIILTRNTDLEQTDEWTPFKAASWLLSTISQCAPESVSHGIVNAKLASTPVSLNSVIKGLLCAQDIVRIESGMIVLGSVLNEDTAETLSPLIKQSIPQIYGGLNSANLVVIDSALWLLERLFKYAYSAMEMCHLDDQIIARILKLITLKTDTSVTAAWSLTGIVNAVRVQGREDSSTEHAIFSNFSMILDNLVSTLYLLQPDDYTIQVALSSAIGEVIKSAVPAYYTQVLGFLSELISITKAQLLNESPNEEIVSCYMNMIQACVSTCSSDQISFNAGSVVKICIYIIDRSNLVSLYTEAYLTLALLADRIGVDFGNYTEEVVRFVIRDLENFSQVNMVDNGGVNIFATSLVSFIGSMASAVQLGFSSHIDQVVPLLIKAIGSPFFPRDAKAMTISTFADISLSTDKIFDKYLKQIIDISISIAHIEDNGTDSTFLLMLKESVLVLFSCIVQGSDGKSKQIILYAEAMIDVIRLIVSSTNDSRCTIKALYLISDLWVLYGTGEYPSIVMALESQWIFDFISRQTQSDAKNVRDAAIATRLQINYINNA